MEAPEWKGYVKPQMIREEVVFYLQSNLGRFQIQELKAQLLSEGVSEEEFKKALITAKRAKTRQLLGKVLMAFGGLLLLIAVLFFLTKRPSQNQKKNIVQTSFVSSLGYVIHIPEGYTAIKTAQSKDSETVYFCKAGTDPSTFLDQGLFGGLGIVKLEVVPRTFSQGPQGFKKLERLVSSRAKLDGSPFLIANTQISDMNGLEITFDAPSSHVLSYVLGRRNLYTFLSGLNNPIYLSILHSLRETQSE